MRSKRPVRDRARYRDIEITNLLNGLSLGGIFKGTKGVVDTHGMMGQGSSHGSFQPVFFMFSHLCPVLYATPRGPKGDVI
jgi:hypothetical protein